MVYIKKTRKSGDKNARYHPNEQVGRRQLLESSSGFVDSGRESLWFLRKILDTGSEVSWDERLQSDPGCFGSSLPLLNSM